MSFLSTTENVGFSGVPQNLSDTTCASQYKMAVEGVPGNHGDVNMFINDGSGDEQTYITHLNDNYFHTKFKIDPNELYTFHDSDVIASEITVSHTEDNFILTDNDVKSKLLDSPSKDIDVDLSSISNGEIKEEKKEVISNGHYSTIKSLSNDYFGENTSPMLKTPFVKDIKTVNNRVSRVKTPIQQKEYSPSNNITEARRISIHSPKRQNNESSSTFITKGSITSVNQNVAVKTEKPALSGKSQSETFLDVFKREQGVVESTSGTNTEPAPLLATPIKLPVSVPKKTPSAGKTPSQSKSRRGRGPAVHEALQRISSQKQVVPVANRTWHAPGEELFECGPLSETKPLPFSLLDTSSSDEDNMPEFEGGSGPVCVEETAAESRGARLAARRAALRRHVAHAHASLRDAPAFDEHKALASMIKKQLQTSNSRLPKHTMNYLLARRGMTNVLTASERRQLREASGWSGGETGSGSNSGMGGGVCAEERCTSAPLPAAKYCLSHVTLAPQQRLFAACAAVFAGGTRCMHPLLPLREHTPLCDEHAWKRDNYDKISRDARPKKVAAVRKRVWPPPPRPPRKPKRRRKPPPRPRPASMQHQANTEINVCSNSSTYDSSEDTTMGQLSENEYIASGGNTHIIEAEVCHVPPDDILDPAVLSQIPDEAFTEFFNQTEGASGFAESSELAAALEAVLDERGLDERALDSIADTIALVPQSLDPSTSRVSEHAAERVIIT